MKYFYLLVITFILTYTARATNRKIPVDTAIVTHHTISIGGIKVSYTATAGTQPLWDQEGNPIATLQYTYYTKKDVDNLATRPLVISFNGGPGSGSVWMHIAYTGPKLLNIDSEGYPVQPYGIHDNPHSIIDVADIVYINPVNTGYSRLITKEGEEVDRKKFFGINADITYLAEWINTFVTRTNRWLSPKFLIGESYGGTRVAGLALALQEKQWMYLNGVILVSPADYKVFFSDPPVSSALNLPYFTATAWYHKKLPPSLQQKDLVEILPEVEQYTLQTLMPAIAKGGFLSQQKKNAIAEKISKYSGLSKRAVLQHHLNVPTQFFWKELLREDGHTIGRLDSRYLGIDKTNGGSTPDYNAELSSWLHAFTPAINYYLQEQLGFKTDVKYNMFGDVHPWDTQENQTRDNLRSAMAQNPYLKVLIQSGYYDGATNYFQAKYTMWQLDPSGKMKSRLDFRGYRSGHMMYLRKKDLEKANNDLRQFILKSTPTGVSAKY